MLKNRKTDHRSSLYLISEIGFSFFIFVEKNSKLIDTIADNKYNKERSCY